jgi:phosphoglycolate phosphatase-like HAD superfamily hydrolase
VRPRILLFDVDGTLIRSGGAGARALERAVAEAFSLGEVRAGFSFAGGTDPAIFRRLLADHGIEPTDDALARTFERYLDVLREEIERAQGYRVNPGMTDALEALAAQDPAYLAVGLGTGNVEPGARIKLSRADLNRHFPFGGFGSDAEDRAALLRAGAARGAARLGRALAECDVVVVGDTPLDVSAAHAIGARCLAVATGGGTRPELAAAGADYLFGSLAESGALDALLEG